MMIEDLGVKEGLIQRGFNKPMYRTPAFTGINFGNKPADRCIPIDIVKFVLLGSDIVIPDNTLFHEELDGTERKRRAANLFGVCSAASRAYRSGSRVFLASEFDHEVDYGETEFAYREFESLRTLIRNSFGEESKRYVLGEAAVCMRMVKKGYRTKIGPPAERKFDAVTQGFCNGGLAFLYTKPALTLNTVVKRNGTGIPVEVVDYITSSMSHVGVGINDRIVFEDTPESIRQKLRVGNEQSLNELYRMLLIAKTVLTGRTQIIAEPIKDMRENIAQLIFSSVITPISEAMTTTEKEIV